MDLVYVINIPLSDKVALAVTDGVMDMPVIDATSATSAVNEVVNLVIGREPRYTHV